jgi:hypothetical protein
MREWCGCGAGIRTWSTRQAIDWRHTHKHPVESAPDEPERNGSHAQVEHAGSRYFEADRFDQSTPIVEARAGFQSNG